MSYLAGFEATHEISLAIEQPNLIILVPFFEFVSVIEKELFLTIIEGFVRLVPHSH